VKRAIPTRELISIVTRGICLRGTYHAPAQAGSRRTLRIGVLAPNGGVIPRAGGADAAVYWADRLSQCGYPAFRFDLPGLGDSDRDPAAEGVDFQEHTDAGGYGPWLSAIADALATRFHLSGIVLLAHCSGAVTAIFGACRNKHIRGLILLDPYFHIQQDSEVQARVTNWNRDVIKGLGGAWSAHPIVRAIGVRALSCARTIYHTLSNVRLFVRQKNLTRAANLPLIRCWNQLASAGVPMLILRSPTYAPRAGGFDYIGYLQKHAPRGSRVTLRPVAGASHAFAERESKEPVARYAEEWLNACFASPDDSRIQECEETHRTCR
jgi:alpha-beta hydrolase superfamily lysophospholipase